MAGPSFNAHKSATGATIKFLCSYGGKILPRYPDGKLRYHGGHTRVLAVDRSISFSELMVKLGEMCGSSVILRCQLPTEDLDALVSITSDEDFVNLIEEYDREAARQLKSLKIRSFLSPPKRLSPSPSSASTTTREAGSPTSPHLSHVYSIPRSIASTTNRCIYHLSKPPIQYNKIAAKLQFYAYGNPSRSYLFHSGNHWQ